METTITAKLNYNTLAYLMGKVDTLIKRAEKIGQAPPTVEILDTEIIEYRHPRTAAMIPVEMTTIRITAQPVRIEGRTLVAVIDHTAGQENLIIELTNDPTPAKYRTMPAYCDHCRTNRNRHKTYLLKATPDQWPTQEYIQIGSTCLKDYTDRTDPAQLAEYLDGWIYLHDEITGREPSSELYEGSRQSDLISLTGYLAAVIESIDHLGYTSRTKARETWTESTADNAHARLDDHNPTEERIDQAKQTAAQAIELINRKAAREGLTTFEHDTLTLINDEGKPAAAFKIQYSGFIAYLPQMVRNMKEREEQLNDDSSSEYIGTPKQRQDFIGLTYSNYFSFDSQYGRMYIHKFKDPAGNVLIWKTGNPLADIEPGETADLTATVKEHTVYKGIKQTVITRAKLNQ